MYLSLQVVSVLFTYGIVVHGQGQQNPVRVCVTDKLSTLCSQMQTDLPDKWECVVGRDKLDCARKMANGEADLTNMDNWALYAAGRYFEGVPIVTEKVEGSPFLYQGIALVSKGSNIQRPEDLKSRRACFTGFGRTVGWQLPIALLTSRSIMSPGCSSHAEMNAAADFFSGGSCAPGTWSSDPIIDQELKNRFEGLCSRCENPSECSSSDKYAGYEGVVRCVVEDAGDVAFTKPSTLDAMLEKDPTLADKVELLCLEGGRRPVLPKDGRCYWGSRPSNAYVTSQKVLDEKRDRLLSVIAETQAMYPPPHVQTPEWYYKVFLSRKEVTSADPVEPERNNYRDYLGEFIFVIEKPRTDCTEEVPSRTYCVNSDEEHAKCEDWARAVISRGLTQRIRCVKTVSKIACMQLVKDGHAQIVTLDGGDVYTAGRYYDMQPISAELYGESDAAYYAVAVIRSASDVTSLSGLKGLRSCHTGVGRTAGWVAPVGALLNHGDLDSNECNRAKSVSEYFEAGSCAPGANDTKYNPGREGAEKLCQNCIGDESGNHRCARDSKERYSGYAGAFRCLAEGRGDVAFVKHTTVPQYTDGKDSSAWSQDLLSSDFKLLCGEGGGNAPIPEYLNCNLCKVPSHYVMTSEQIDKTTRLDYAALLGASSTLFGPKSELFRIFGKYADKADLLFKDATTSLRTAPLDDNYRQVLGEEFFKASEAVDPKACQS